MMHFIISFVSIITALFFMQMSHPLAMGLMLMIQTLLMCLLTGLMTKTFWFSYILLLIFLGGMLVLFIYVTSLASNEMFSISFKMLMFFLSSLFLIFFMMIIMDNYFISNFNMNNEMESITKILSYLPENTINLNKMYNFPTNLITIILINYLFLTLIVIVKITNLFYGPLRPSKN
uniref:NADH-ubiquinone oxidoreductase chain 6 n=1 Tax=Sylvicola fenestralis TaxID=52754 RepID=G8J8L3_9DIPT|nr:NADH dehydrogenase subunit 6 [Sylvicola fenestralis]AET13131.1 NADH dehydrogenase subunit 6 [Sylvicola fenestralis]